MKKIILLIVLIFISLVIFLSAYDYVKNFDEYYLENIPTEKIENTENEFAVESIFNRHFTYQGFINYDSNFISAYTDSHYDNYIEKCIIENGIDLKVMSEDIISDLGVETAESCTLLIYFDDFMDTNNLNFELYGIGNITIFGDDVEKEFTVSSDQKHLLVVSDFLNEIGMIRIVLDDYARVLENGAYIKQI